jgi:uncharacterized lipoprotein NlpE involved in copper resistance
MAKINPKLGLIAIVILTLAGCSQGEDDGLSKKDQEAGTRIEQIAKASGGDWSKVSDADKKYLVDEVSMGSEQSARKLIEAKSGKMAGGPGGPAQPGGPKGRP